jgi:hypothetical protein
VAAVVIFGFFAGFVAEFVINLVFDFVLKLDSLSAIETVNFVISLVLGAIVGGVMFLGRPRHYGTTALAGASAVVSGMIADEIATSVYFVIRHMPVTPELIAGYFTQAPPIFWINNLLSFAVAAGLTALRVRGVRAAEGAMAGAGMPSPSWGPPAAPPGPWGPQPQQPYGGVYPQSPPPYGPPPRAPYDPPPPAPYGPPPPAPYGPPS